MVSLELLSSLDGLLWLQSGAKVGALFQQHQTTVSRNQKNVFKSLESHSLNTRKIGANMEMKYCLSLSEKCTKLLSPPRQITVKN